MCKYLFIKKENMMMNKILILIVLLSLFACSQKEERNMLFNCEGKMILGKGKNKEVTEGLNFRPVQTSFFIGKDFVESEGSKYKICSEFNTQIKYANNCENPHVEGLFDKGMQRLNETKEGDELLSYRALYTCKKRN